MLKHRVDRAQVGGKPGDVVAFQQDRAFRHILEPGDAAQKRGLAAAGRPQQREELVVPDPHGHARQRSERAKALDHLAHSNDLDHPARFLKAGGYGACHTPGLRSKP